MVGRYILDKTVTSAAAIVVLLQLDKLEFPKRLEDGLQVLFSDVEVNVPDIKPVEWNGVRVRAGCFRAADLAVLLGFGELNNDRDT